MNPLRWYERRLLEWLARSPRISRILVETTTPFPAPRGALTLPEIARHFEHLYQAPSAKPRRRRPPSET